MRHGKGRFLFGALSVPLLLYGVFVISPYLQAFYLAFTDWNGVSNQVRFTGLDNFVKLVKDPLFLAALRNNGLLLLFVPLAIIAIALVLATLAKGTKVFGVLYFFPQLLSVAIIAVLWGFVYNPRHGLLNGVLDVFGIPGVSWLAEPNLALWCVMAAMIWAGVGFYFVLFTAAMQQVPAEVYEAASLDGASGFTLLRRITLPLIKDSVQTAYVYIGIAALDGFALVQIMTVGPGGPDNATEVMGLTLYRSAFTFGQFGYASAMGVALFLLTLSLSAVALRRRSS